MLSAKDQGHDSSGSKKRQLFFNQMGATGSQGQQLRSLPRDNWELLGPGGGSERLPAFGQCKVYRNLLTSQEVEQYGLLFETSQHCDSYIASFVARLQEQDIVNTRFIQLESSLKLCGCGKYARVYLERIPLRLSQIDKVDSEDISYVIATMLGGFERLFRKYGYFKTCRQMVGIDREGRVKVWMNVDFSMNSHYFPVDFEGKTQQLQEKMVIEVVQLVQTPKKGTALKQGGHQLVEEIRANKGRLTFSRAIQIVKEFTLSSNITPRNYFQSVLPLIHSRPCSSEDLLPQMSNYDVDDNSFTPIHTRHKIIYYVDPLENSDGLFSSEGSVERGHPLRRSTASDNISMMSQPDCFGKTPQNGGFQSDNDFGAKSRLKVQFNYNNVVPVYPANMIPSYFKPLNLGPCGIKKTDFPESRRGSASESNIGKGDFCDFQILDKELLQDIELYGYAR